ncbi:Hypothetical protein A7982_06843 [Minicystis rosea]|nr:Hypothetical protein A7982_06843 [Minicystis rosea]
MPPISAHFRAGATAVHTAAAFARTFSRVGAALPGAFRDEESSS